jgi:hypothetical protein
MLSQELLDAQIGALRSLMPPVDAFGLWGSFGMGVADDLSDLDFIVFISRDEFWSLVKSFPVLITHPLPVVSQGIGRFVQDHGFQYAYILSGGHKLEYHLNSQDTMARLPLSARTHVVEDRSGCLTAYLAEAQLEFERDVRPHVAAGVHDCLVYLHDLRKYALRGDLLPMVWRMDSLRRPVIALDHMGRSGDVYAPSSALSHLPERSSAEHARLVMETVPAVERTAMADAFEKLRGIMLAAWRQFSPTGVPSKEQLDLEQTLSEAILTSLRAQWPVLRAR